MYRFGAWKQIETPSKTTLAKISLVGGSFVGNVRRNEDSTADLKLEER